MAKTRVGDLIEKLSTATEPESASFDDLIQYGRAQVPKGFLGKIPEYEWRQEDRARLASMFERLDHTSLARVAADLLEQSAAHKACLAHFTGDKEVKHRNAQADLKKAAYEEQQLFLDILREPQTRSFLGGMARAERDPVSARKPDVEQFWLDRKAGKHPKLRTNRLFAAECVRRWPELKQTTIESKWIPGWQRRWRAAHKI